MGTLYIVPTPIGNLEDITLRALRTLREVTLIAAEDTRTTGQLLAHYEVTTPQTSYHEHNRYSKIETIVEALATGDVALVSDAGTPGISDPGYELVQGVLAAGYEVVPLPGPTALIPAVVASGLPAATFLYLGFLPRKQSDRAALLAQVKRLPYTLVVYEAPHRLHATLSDLYQALGNRQMAAARELTKLYEEIWRGTLKDAPAHFEEPRGEFVLVVGPAEEESPWTEERVREALAAELDAGMSRSKAAKAVAALSGWAKSDVYALDL
jgi:16S rRNA (cytidine1402-2'-O)-methyltransferase